MQETNMKVKRKIIQIDEELCNGCGQCVPACAEGTLEVIDGKAKVVSDNLCDGLGACLGECPTGALKIIQREAEEFDEHAVEKRLSELNKGNSGPSSEPMPCGCPSTHIMSFAPGSQCPGTKAGALDPSTDSQLTHWPVKIRLVPAEASFLNGADVLVLADCAAAAYPKLHQDLLKGRKVLMGCPKFDDVEEYIDKFEKICRHGGIKSVTNVIMDVPCCSGLHAIVRKGCAASGKRIGLEEITIDRKGSVLKCQKVA